MSQATTYVGVDNATSGALAVLPPNGIPILYPFVTLPKVPKQSTELDDAWFYSTCQSIVAEHGPVRFVVERAQKFSPGILALCSTWGCYGAIRMCLRGGLRAPFIPIDPKMWQAVMFRGMLSGDSKDKSIRRAKELYPNISLQKTLRSTTPNDGMSDALLIAHYGKLINL